jgi:diketogulonate reductase-like aldo/keto reductase
MEQIQRDGLAKSIGVSNFSTKSLQTILDVCEVRLPSHHPLPPPCHFL